MKGVVIAKSESLVTCDFKAVEEAVKRGRASFAAEDSVTAGSAEGEERVIWNCSQSVRVVAIGIDIFFDMLNSIFFFLIFHA